MNKMMIACMALILSILFTGCTTMTATSGPSTKLNIDMNEFMFTPNSYSIPAGQKITLVLKNSGAIEHDFIILKKDVEIKGSFDPEKYANDIVFHAALESQKSGEFTFTAPAEAGEYQIICGVLGHFQAGMLGTLTVVGQ